MRALGPKGSYNAFAGRDASKAFITGAAPKALGSVRSW